MNYNSDSRDVARRVSETIHTNGTRIRTAVTRHLYIFATHLLVLTSCADSSFMSVNGDKAITFNTQLSQTRAAAYTETGATAYKTMGVYVANSAIDFDNTTPVSLMADTKVERDNGSDGWYYSPAKMWKEGNKHTFFAYAPYYASGLTKTNAGGVPSMTFAVNTISANQIDLLVAKARYDLENATTGTVQLEMRHALTRILFSAKLTYEPSLDSIVTITEITLSGLNNSATRKMDFSDPVGWTGQNGSADYTLISNGTQLSADPLTSTLQEITREEGNLYLIPQTIPAGAKLSVKYITTHKVNGGSKGGLLTITKDLATVLDNFLPSEAVRFILTVPNTTQPELFEINVTHEPWDDKETEVAVPSDPYLDITNVSVHSYDAAITRVYFYTNQPATVDGDPNVFINAQGREGTSYGKIIQIKDEFYAIAQGDPDGTSYFHFDDASNRGYIDIVNRKTSTAGDGPNKGKQPVILKLHAGKIVRDITVQPVVTEEAAKGNPTPYIGTFHRHTETGERILTWHLPDSIEWTATIDNGAGTHHANLSIDRLASPDFSNNVLYSLSPRDAEGAKVDPIARSVKGKGRVYFRVGWQTPSPAPTNRYARIQVTYPHLSGAAGDTTVYIYCRQGETEQQIAVAPSLFNVYNVGQFRQFTQYPTQAGMLYQWNRTTGWDPLGLSKPPGYPNTIETEFSYERSACPEGYLYPSQLQVLEIGAVLAPDRNWKLWGYYADGFFDRRRINVGDHRVEASSLEVAGAGILFYNGDLTGATTGNQEPRAIFLPTTGHRKDNSDSRYLGELAGAGTHSGYWTDLANGTQSTGMLLHKDAGPSSVTDYNRESAYSIRCIKLAAGSAWILRFDANGGENAPISMTIPISANQITLPTTAPNNYYLENYVFDSWNTKSDGSGTTFSAGGLYSRVSPDDTLYAIWRPI